MESLIMSLEVFCFKQNLPLRQFFDLVYNLYLAAEELDIPLEKFPGYIEELKAHIDSLIEQIQQKESEKQNALEEYHTTKHELQEFVMSRPTFEKNQQLKQESEQVTKERDKQIQNRPTT
jgi:chromosome segregation ATPase